MFSLWCWQVGEKKAWQVTRSGGVGILSASVKFELEEFDRLLKGFWRRGAGGVVMNWGLRKIDVAFVWRWCLGVWDCFDFVGRTFELMPFHLEFSSGGGILKALQLIWVGEKWGRSKKKNALLVFNDVIIHLTDICRTSMCYAKCWVLCMQIAGEE